jgi:tetratricopeptide (TPR) repeat protein
LRVSSAKISRFEQSHSTEPKQNLASPQIQVVSDTIANIFFSQGHYERALEAYQTLLFRKPENKLHYQQRIAECQQRLSQQ